MDFYQQYPKGSGGLADPEMIERAGLNMEPEGLYLGLDGLGRPTFSNQQAAIYLQGGARGYKGDHLIPWLVDGHYRDHIISMDWKSENAPISQLQVAQGRDVINFAPRYIPTGEPTDLVTHSINPLEFIDPKSSTFFADAKFHTKAFIPTDGSENGKYFQETAQRYNEAVLVTAARKFGTVTMPLMAEIMFGFGGLSDDWMAIEYQMSVSGDKSISSVVEELQEIRKGSDSNAGGFKGIKNEISRAYASLSDPQMLASLSPPFTWSISELTKPDSKPTLLNIMESMTYSETTAPIIKALYSCVSIFKQRHPRARKQLWLLDEIGNLNAWPEAIKMATYSAGLGIRVAYVSQSSSQLNKLGRSGKDQILNSCGTQIYKATRSITEADPISRTIGDTTIKRPNFKVNHDARIAMSNALHKTQSGQIDPFQTGRVLAQQAQLAEHMEKDKRRVITGDEIINMPGQNCIVMMPGVLERPMMVFVPHYWQRPELAGRYLGNPYISPDGAVEISHRGRQEFAEIITEPTPEELQHLPQYDSHWCYVRGYRPALPKG